MIWKCFIASIFLDYPCRFKIILQVNHLPHLTHQFNLIFLEFINLKTRFYEMLCELKYFDEEQFRLLGCYTKSLRLHQFLKRLLLIIQFSHTAFSNYSLDGMNVILLQII